MSQTVYRELHPPTAITHCAEAYFTHAAGKQPSAVAPNLVVVRGTHIEVYALNYGSSGTPPAGTVPSTCRMELVGRWQCWGVIEDMAVLRGRGSSGQRDSIIIAARDAKVAVIEWDDQLHCLKSGSLHSFEGDPALREGCPGGTAGPGPALMGVAPRVVADPNGRCAAALVYGRHLALLLAIQADVLEMLLQEGGSSKISASSASVGNSYLVHLAKVPSLKLSSECAVRAMTFLHGYTEPVLLLLHEATPTWGGRLREARDTCCLSAMSINLRKKRQPVIWSVPQLPSDCTGLLAVPRGGVLVFSQNLLLYYAQGGSCVMAMNSNNFAEQVPPRLDPPVPPTFPPFPPRSAAEIQAATAAAAEKAVNAATAHARQWATNVHPETVAAAGRGAPRIHGLELEADGAVGCWLAGNVALLSLKTGQLLLVSLKFEGAAASKIQVLVAGSAAVASCAATLTSNLLFLGSTVGDSLLVRYYPESLTPTSGPYAAAATGLAAAPSLGLEHLAKRRRLASLASADMGGGGEGNAAAGEAGDAAGIDDDGELYRGAIGRAQNALLPIGDGLKHNLKVMDSLLCLGPIGSTVVADLHLRESDVHAGNPSADSKPSACLVAAVGSEKSGALAVMRRGMVADVITAVPSLQAHGAWTLHYREPQAVAGPDSSSLADLSDQHHAFLLLSCGGRNTMVLDARGDQLAELEDNEQNTVAFVRDAPTLAVGEVFRATAAVQVTHSTVRLVRGSSEMLQELPLAQLLADAGHPAAAAEAGSTGGDAANMQQDTPSMCIKYAQVRDPYVLLLLSDASVLLLQGNAARQQLALLPAALPELAEASWGNDLARVSAACLYSDTTGWLAAAAGIAADSAGAGGDAVEGGDTETQPAEGQDEQQQQQQEDTGNDYQQGSAAEAADEDAQMAEAAADAPAAGDAPAADGTTAQQRDTAAAAAAASHAEQQHEEKDEKMGEVDEKAAVAAVAPGDVKQAAGDETEQVTAAGGEGGVDGAGSAAAAAPVTTIAVPESDDAVLEGVEGVDVAMAVASAAEDAAEDAETPAAADGTEPQAAPEPQQQQQQQEQQQEQQQGDNPSQPAAEEAPDAGAGAGDVSGTAGQQQKQAPAPAVITFCAIVRAGGGLQVYALPSMTCVFEDAEAVLGHQALSPHRPPSPYEEDVDEELLQPSPVSEMMMECFAGSSGGALGVAAAAAPLLVMLTDEGTCLVYKAYKPDRPGSSIGFRRQPLDPQLLAQQSPAAPAAPAPGTKAAAGVDPEHLPSVPGMPLRTAAPCRLVRFDHLVTPKLQPPLGPRLAGATSDSAQLPQLRYSGVFVCGPHPVWLVASRGGLLAHPMEPGVGQVDTFCAFHNLNCRHGYIAASLHGEMMICTLPLQLRLDQPWLTSKLPLRATPTALIHYPEARLLAIATSHLAAPPRPFLPADPGGDAVAAAAYATAEAVAKAAAVEGVYELQLLAPPGCGLELTSYVSVSTAIKAAASAAAVGSTAASSARAAATAAAAAGWAGLPLWRYSLLPGEEVLTLKHVLLCEGGDETANPEPYIAVGCCSTFGEDYPALGRVLLFQVMKDRVFRLEGGSETKIHARLALQRECPGPVTALECLRGFLIMAVGNRLEMHYKQGNTLVKVTFFDGLQMGISLSLVKDYILVGQLGHSAAFMRYSNALDPVTRERQQQLQPMSNDTERLDSWAVEFMPNANKLNQVLADGGGNLSVLLFDRANPESWAGKKLLRRGAAHVGALISQLTRLRLAVPGDSSNRQALLGATAQGGLLLLSPFWDEGMYKRLSSLHEELVYRLPHTAGLNPKAFQGRYVRAGPAYGAGFSIMKPLKPLDNTLLQGDLVWAYAGLDLRAQTVIAEAVGAEPQELLQDLRLLSVACNFL